MRYPDAEWVPWQGSAYYAGINRPKAVVLHIQQGWQSTYRRWAQQGHHRASVHYSIGRDGSVIQMLDHEDGGYHAGITPYKAAHYTPTWPLWEGPNKNVNHYTIGVEHEGFYDEIFKETGTPFTLAQANTSKRLCNWLAAQLDIPLDEAHFPAHAVIDLRDRPYDFATPTARKRHYDYLFERTKDMADEEARELAEKALAEAEAAKAHSELRNDIVVMQRDVESAINAPWPALAEIHKLLREHGYLRDDHEYEGDYAGYA